ncbi:MAG: DegT/DnrJ/EryC1/StrS family aminotransferase [Betaproteobacteria bacterium]
MHLSTLFRAKGHREGEFPHAERISRETVTLPLYPAMTTADVERVCVAAGEILEQHIT